MAVNDDFGTLFRVMVGLTSHLGLRMHRRMDFSLTLMAITHLAVGDSVLVQLALT